MICAEALNGQEVVVHVGRDLRRDDNAELVQCNVRLLVDVHCRTHTLAAAGLNIPKYCKLALALLLVGEVIAGARIDIPLKSLNAVALEFQGSGRVRRCRRGRHRA